MRTVLVTIYISCLVFWTASLGTDVQFRAFLPDIAAAATELERKTCSTLPPLSTYNPKKERARRAVHP
jgi:hypothetical protein